jgi:hypothetical protein
VTGQVIYSDALVFHAKMVIEDVECVAVCCNEQAVRIQDPNEACN